MDNTTRARKLAKWLVTRKWFEAWRNNLFDCYCEPEDYSIVQSFMNRHSTGRQVPRVSNTGQRRTRNSMSGGGTMSGWAWSSICGVRLSLRRRRCRYHWTGGRSGAQGSRKFRCLHPQRASCSIGWKWKSAETRGIFDCAFPFFAPSFYLRCVFFARRYNLSPAKRKRLKMPFL